MCDLTYGSVFSGLEAASIAWESLGLKPLWFCEIDKFPSAVLAHHWPHVPNWHDALFMPEVISSGLAQAPDILVGGSPCQSFSVAGLRKGLEDSRGQLTLKYVELVDAIDKKRKERGESECVVLWENVPGVLSSKDNAFGAFLGALCGEDCELEPTGKKWTNAGVVYGPKRAIAWRILDAKYFGVAQRRRRVFVVASAREGFRPTEVLFKSEGMRRDIAPRREEVQTFTRGTAQGFREGSFGSFGEEIGALCFSDEKGVGYQYVNDGKLVLFEPRSPDGTHRIHDNLSPTLNTAGGGQRQPCVCLQGSMIGRSDTAGPRGKGVNEEVCFTLNTSDRHAIATPTHFKYRGGCDGGGKGYLGNKDTAFTLSTSQDQTLYHESVVRRLTPLECERLQGFKDNHTLVPYGVRQKKDKEMHEYYTSQLGSVLTEDEYRALASDGPRYKAIGNSMAVPVIKWLGERIIKEINRCN